MDKVPVWYCEALGTVLANEEVLATAEGPRSERGNHPVERRPLRQWMLRITAYADRLLQDLDTLDWPESIKDHAAQLDWPQPGAQPSAFALADNTTAGMPNGDDYIDVFSTRPDTLYGATYMVLAPEHPLTNRITSPKQHGAVQAYIAQARVKSDLERTDLTKDKSGVFSGAYAINPVNGHRLPIWVADYVLVSYGTGAIMAVPAHDERDYEFATRYALPIEEVCVAAHSEAKIEAHSEANTDSRPELPFTGYGVSTNSGPIQWSAHSRMYRCHNRLARGAPTGAQDGYLQAARLDIFAPALLGRADPTPAQRRWRGHTTATRVAAVGIAAIGAVSSVG